jgi:hypothetical protein
MTNTSRRDSALAADRIICVRESRWDVWGGERHVRTRGIDRILWFCEGHDVDGQGVYYCVSSIRGTR